MALSASGRRRKELEGLLKSAITDYRRYVKECAKHELKAAAAECMKVACKMTIADCERRLSELDNN